MNNMANTDGLLADLCRLYEAQGKVPTAQDYRDNGNYPLQHIYDKFGSIVDAREQAGIDEEQQKDIPHKIERERILMDINGLWRHLGRVPSSTDYREYGKHSLKAVYRAFNSWIDARKEAGVYDGNLWNLDKSDIIERLQTLYEEKGSEPTIYDYQERFSEHHDIFYDYGGFVKLKKDAGVYEGEYGNEARKISKLDMVEDLRKKAELVDGPLSIEDYREIGDYSIPTITKEFDSFISARAEAGLESSSLLLRTGTDHPLNTAHNEDIYKLARYRRNRPKVLERDGSECKHCGMTSEEHIRRYGRDLHSHHIYPVRLVEYPDDSIHALCNMAALCEKCHGMYEGWFYSPSELVRRFGPAN
jgi:hypothetical protein